MEAPPAHSQTQLSSASTASDEPASPAASCSSLSGSSLRRKQVCFHPLALCISTAPDGEIELAMAHAAKEELAQRKRRMGIKTYRSVLILPPRCFA